MTDRTGSSVPDLDAMLDILANRYRRRLLVACLRHNPQDDDPQIPGDIKLDSEGLDSLMIHMRHIHLPKLKEAGFIELDRETNTVRKGPSSRISGRCWS
ncbi:hypothetical protein V5735_23320 (plasmid) [Haladaptatus sp. SPP-AMP-3]|uniref:DUF7344 domain-containing protein n=1 Tax=Haladaptatus sp. SPP-AMP-3 TaxID=3121295 RepID=UPI003C2D6B99